MVTIHFNVDGKLSKVEGDYTDDEIFDKLREAAYPMIYGEVELIEALDNIFTINGLQAFFADQLGINILIRR